MYWFLRGLVIVVFTFSVFAQRNNSALSKHQNLNSLREQLFDRVPFASRYYSETVGKCGFGIAFEFAQNWEYLTPEQQRHYKLLTTPTQTQKSRIIGRFIIFYDTTGMSAPAVLDRNGNPIPNSTEAYVDSVGRIFNYVWQVDSILKYTLPPFEQGLLHYRIIVSELFPYYYGITSPTDIVFDGTPRRQASYITIDNDFRFFYSEGMAGLKVTAAHEFHHAIQIGSYGEWTNDYYFYEITSTWMEDVIYTDVNDYYQYLFNVSNQNRASQFSNPEVSFISVDRGIHYSRAVWGKFIEKKFSPTLIRRTWEHMRQLPSLKSLDNALQESGSSLREALIEYSLWNAQTGPDCDTIAYYTEGKYYPTMNFRSAVQFTPPARSIADSIQTLGAIYHPILVNNTTMLAMIMNLNTASRVSTNYLSFSYDISQSGGEGYKHLRNGLYVKLNVSDPENWYTLETVPAIVDDIVVYPNPMFSPQTTSLKFRLPTTANLSVTLDIFSASLRHIFSNTLPVVHLRPFEPGVIWNGKMDNGEDAPSGIYIFILKDGDREYKGKFSILRN
jgi:hypothetical protein